MDKFELLNLSIEKTASLEKGADVKDILKKITHGLGRIAEEPATAAFGYRGYKATRSLRGLKVGAFAKVIEYAYKKLKQVRKILR